jgi:hypothetical protein
MTVTAPIFNECAVKQICASLPKGIDQRRLDLLPRVLNEWSGTLLREHLSRDTPATRRKRDARLTKVGKYATHLRQALEAIDQRGKSWIAQETAERTALLQRHPLHSVRNPTMGAANKIRRKN